MLLDYICLLTRQHVFCSLFLFPCFLSYFFTCLSFGSTAKGRKSKGRKSKSRKSKGRKSKGRKLKGRKSKGRKIKIERAENGRRCYKVKSVMNIRGRNFLISEVY